ncbi:hypothetical protein LOTGIDRAFT_234344 [Lottia gigantea]|uniref:PUB domain-containing protein n=1 Tax=Lottia gigantea TaxID=225164 RepID=V4A3K8_LOTGI|nr:hypothetical protein LOTGIDRAFT_234344 [Lottia gigantea]ESO89540.1 hypothetical protein LOTGIDRAFT_234344 [Lottia gigantea]
MAGVTPSSNVIDTESLSICVQLLQTECEDSTANLKAALDLIIKICRNIQQNPSEEKYKKIKKESKSLKEKVWKYDGGQQLLLTIGWTEVDDSIIFLEEKDLSGVIKFLEDKLKEYGLTNGANSTSSTTQVQSGWSEAEMKEKERLLKEQKEKFQAQIRRKREEQKRVKTQIEADRDNIKARELKASKAVERKFGNNVKRFGDIGVNLDGQGG